MDWVDDHRERGTVWIPTPVTFEVTDQIQLLPPHNSQKQTPFHPTPLLVDLLHLPVRERGDIRKGPRNIATAFEIRMIQVGAQCRYVVWLERA
jgi:hypothetical protein